MMRWTDRKGNEWELSFNHSEPRITALNLTTDRFAEVRGTALACQIQDENGYVLFEGGQVSTSSGMKPFITEISRKSLKVEVEG